MYGKNIEEMQKEAIKLLQEVQNEIHLRYIYVLLKDFVEEIAEI